MATIHPKRKSRHQDLHVCKTLPDNVFTKFQPDNFFFNTVKNTFSNKNRQVDNLVITGTDFSLPEISLFFYIKLWNVLVCSNTPQRWTTQTTLSSPNTGFASSFRYRVRIRLGSPSQRFCENEILITASHCWTYFNLSLVEGVFFFFFFFFLFFSSFLSHVKAFLKFNIRGWHQGTFKQCIIYCSIVFQATGDEWDG